MQKKIFDSDNGNKIKAPPWQTITGRKTRQGREDGVKQIDTLGLIMLGLGGAIGSGIFVASGIPIHLAGPGVILVFLVGGIVNMLVLMMLAEMGVAHPVSGSFSIYAEKYLGLNMGFVSGWIYWTSGILTLAAEMVAAAMIARFWLPAWPIWSLSLIVAVVITGISLLDVRAFARVEEWLSLIKVGVLILVIVLGVVWLAGLRPGFSSPGLANYVAHDGFFPHGWEGMLSALLLVMYTYAGGQVIGLAMGDTREPVRTVPKAVMVINFTLLILYPGSISILLGLVPWTDVPQSGSAFIPLFQSLAGVAGIINAVILSAVLSAMNSNMFGVPRMLNSLAERHEAPAFLARRDRRGVPVAAVLVSAIFLLVVVGLSFLLPQQIFVYIASASGVTILLNWVIIAATHLRFRRQTEPGQDEKLLRYPGCPYTNYGIIIILLVTLTTAAFSHDQLVGLIAGLVLLALYACLFYILRCYLKSHI